MSDTGEETPQLPRIGDMLRHIAADLDKSDPDVPIVAATVIILRADGQWSAMASPQLSPFMGSALLDHAKTDLIMGGQRWTEYQPHAAANESNTH